MQDLTEVQERILKLLSYRPRCLNVIQQRGTDQFRVVEGHIDVPRDAIECADANGTFLVRLVKEVSPADDWLKVCPRYESERQRRSYQAVRR